MTTPSAPPHSLIEDIQALLVGTLFIALSVVLFRHAGLLTGGTAGMAFLLHYVSGYPFGAIFFVINLPFYIFAVRALGWTFTFKTFAAIAMLSLYSEILPHWIQLGSLQPVFATVMAGLLAGVGLLMLMRHNASLGGLGVMAIYLQKTRGWRAGKVQMAGDCLIVGTALLVKDVSLVALSVLGAVALNLVITINHRPGRYTGF
ncbi:MAG: YitT family protein [Formivibrio sp.]|nr:YitT family protein [Formivibrio sp.]